MSIVNDIRTAFSRRDNALNQLLLINVLVFAVLIVLRAILFVTSADAAYGVVLRQLALPSSLPGLLRHPWTLLTYAFTHEGFLHVIFNMLNLYWFGALLQEYLGNRKLVSVYILGALAGAALYLLAFNLIPVFQGKDTILLGASASVTAIIMAAATLLPDYTFNLLLVGPVRIKYIAAVLVLVSIAGINGGNPGGMMAHLGGAILGFTFIRLLRTGRDLGTPVHAVGDFVANLVGRPNMSVTHRSRTAEAPTAKKGGVTQPEEEEINLILDKISRSGYESLSKDEKQKLFKASQK